MMLLDQLIWEILHQHIGSLIAQIAHYPYTRQPLPVLNLRQDWANLS